MENNKLDKRTKWSYCIGATGRDMAYALISMFLLTYIQYTMKLTVAQYAVISAIMVVCLLWDAINDPMMGIIIENSHLKAGKFKPWIFIGVILNSLIIICLFTVRPEGWGFSIIIPIIGSLMASHSRHTTIIADITAYWATVSFIVY
jgi:melibiose permease/lactose/raffinose/galactose permease